MTRKFHHYEKWEDFHNGLYKIWDCSEELKERCIELLIDLPELEKYMKMVVDQWVISAEQQMTNPSRNKQAWLWQAACCMKFWVNEDNVKEAWFKLMPEEQSAANLVADKIINYYKTTYGTKISRN